MATIGGPDNIIEDGLVFYMDAANTDSYTSGSNTISNLLGPETGSVNNNVSFESSNAGILTWDGSDSQVELGTPNILMDGMVGSYSISLWVKSSDTSNTPALFGNNTTNWAQYYKFSIYVSSNKPIFAALVPNQKECIAQTKEINDGIWHNIVATYNNSVNGGEMKIYIDKFLDKTVTSAGTSPTTDRNNTLYWGSRSSIQELNGSMACVSVYHKALSQLEINQNYNALKGRFI